MIARLTRITLIIAVAVLVNVLICMGLALLNRASADNAPSPVKTRLTIHTLPPSVRRVPEQPPAPSPVPLPEQPITVNLDLPAPQVVPLQLPALQLDLAIPTLSPPTVTPEPVPAAAEAPPPPPQPTAAHVTDNVVRSPRALLTPSPRYPTAALRRGRQGSVATKILINTRGRVDEVIILSTTGHRDFAAAVRTAVARWQFAPANRQGKPVSAWANKTFKFELNP